MASINLKQTLLLIAVVVAAIVLNGSVNNQSNLLSYLAAFLLLGLVFLLSLPLLALLGRKKRSLPA